MNIKNAFIAIAAIAVAALLGPAAQAQPPQGGPGGHEGGPPPGGHPVIAALDVDQNHELSAEEINNATKVLKALDKNGDGKLDEEDLGRIGPPGGGPQGGGGPGGGGPGGGRRGGPGGQHGGGDAADAGEQVNDFASRLMAFDKNENGKVEKDELPTRMQRVMDNLDKNKDDVLDSSELNELKKAATEASSSSNGRGNRGARGGDRGGRGGEREARGGDRGGRGERGGPPGGGGGSERMIEHAFEFDKDGDGKLSREELAEFAESMPQPGGQGMGGPGGRGGGPGGGRGGPGGRPPRGR